MAHPAAWLHRVGVNLANSYFRRRRAERRAASRAGTTSCRALISQLTSLPTSGDGSIAMEALTPGYEARRLGD